jgi:tRNA1Val (adenine37-N6)-methyltransferase
MKVTTDSCLFGAWIAESISSTSEQKETQNILDIGTGTGLLSLMFAQKNREVKIDAIEIDSDAATQAKHNVSFSAWKEKINIIEADVKTYTLPGLYDVIITNPPFYQNELSSPSSKKNVAHHGEGLLLKDLLFIIKQNLKKNGKFFILSSIKRHYELEELIPMHNLFILEKLFVRQTVDHPISRLIICGSTKPTEQIITSEFSIRDNNQYYTPEFTNLLKEYYLDF